MEKEKKPFYRKWWFILIVIIVLISIVTSVKKEIGNASDKKAVYTWPDSVLASMIPQPDSKNGRVIMENEDYFSIDIYKVSKEYFKGYVEECKNSGFTENYMKYDNSYSADNKDGYSLWLTYDEKEKTLNIRLSSDIPEESSSEPEETPETTGTESETETGAETKDEPEPVSVSNASLTETSEGIRPEFKEILDGYEAFMNEYCEFMKKYTTSDDVLSMAMDYAQMMQKEIEWIDKIEDLEDTEMNEAEAKYYTEVILRVEQKLLEVAL